MLLSGAYEIEINPHTPQFLFGYPHVERMHTGIHDSIYTQALFLTDGKTQQLIFSNDLIYVTKYITKMVREGIFKKKGIPKENIMLTATHTHSGPKSSNDASSKDDPIVPPLDMDYVNLVIDKMILAGVKAIENAEEAKIGFIHADSTGIGTNRRYVDGPSNHDMPVFVVKNYNETKTIACMYIVSMHPTVMHEDSKLISADFIGGARDYLKENVFDKETVIITCNGPCGNLSPRHVVRQNIFSEVKRIGEIVGKAIEKVATDVEYSDNLKLDCKTAFMDNLPRKKFPELKSAQENLSYYLQKIENQKKDGTSAADIRTTECDIFGAEETVTLSKMQDNGELEKFYQSSLPAEIQLMKIGGINFVGWSGEVFVDYALEVKKNCPNTFVISLANGEMQGYITTEEAYKEGGYEASNSLFHPSVGNLFVEETIKICR